MSGGGGNTQKTSNAPWSAQQPYLQYGYQNAGNLYGQPISPEAMQGYQAWYNRAQAGSPLTRAAQDFTQAALTGNNNAIVSSFRPQLDTIFEQGGRMGGTARSEAFGRGFANAAMPYAQLAPYLAQLDYQDIGQGIEAANAPYNEELRRLAAYMNVVGGNQGGVSTTTGGKGANTALQGIGTAAQVASAANSIYNG